MAKIGRPGLSREKKAELWERWKSGQCASDIARKEHLDRERHKRLERIATSFDDFVGLE
jgi:hypothetical protein